MTTRPPIDRTPPAERALVIHPVRGAGSAVSRSPAARLDEAVGLVQALDLEIAGAEVVTLRSVTPATVLAENIVMAPS